MLLPNMLIRRSFSQNTAAGGRSDFENVEKYFSVMDELKGKTKQSDEAFDKYRNHLELFEKLVYDLEGDQQLV